MKRRATEQLSHSPKKPKTELKTLKSALDKLCYGSCKVVGIARMRLEAVGSHWIAGHVLHDERGRVLRPQQVQFLRDMGVDTTRDFVPLKYVRKYASRADSDLYLWMRQINLV